MSRLLSFFFFFFLFFFVCFFFFFQAEDGIRDRNVTGVQTCALPILESIENIGQWEFLSVSDEELIDTIRRGFFGDDQLVRIYYGTLRLGIDMKDVKEGWLQASQDSIVCTLPPIKLLDHNFIDEAKTKSFFEEGKWTGSDRQAMYERAYQAMKKRCLNRTNIDRKSVV